MIHELELVALVQDQPEFHLEAGDVGTVVMVHQNSRGYEVEFATFTGETIAVVTLASDSVRPLRQRELAHAREVA